MCSGICIFQEGEADSVASHIVFVDGGVFYFFDGDGLIFCSDDA